MVLPRILSRYIKILFFLDTTELSPKEIKDRLNLLSVQYVYEAIRRRKKHEEFYAEQFSKFLQNHTSNKIKFLP
jgi:hypothetical protein